MDMLLCVWPALNPLSIHVREAKYDKMANFWTYGLKYWETVEDKWVRAAMRLTSIDSSSSMWHLPRLCQGRTHGGQNVPQADCRNWRTFFCDSHPSCFLLLSNLSILDSCSRELEPSPDGKVDKFSSVTLPHYHDHHHHHLQSSI